MKSYKLNDEINELFVICNGFDNAIKISLLIPFCHKRTVKLVKEKEKTLAKAWDMVHELYPELKNYNLIWNGHTKEVCVNEK